jgi:transcription-repair coupling factor (superfamily II helicase)
VKKILERTRAGQVDILIGTHRLLSKDVQFADLGLVIIDEEQRFGVEHKERLLALRLTVDVLTLSATPIPRTLHMSMLGLRDISSLSTPPMDRRAVVTEVIPFNRKRIQAAIARELARDGQVFFVHNRVYNIESVADDILKLAPDARIVVGHGQMPDKQLEDVMLKFMRREADILVSTTIIESGIDIPTANTMIINDADRFGLSDLHQLRGRVGRYKHRAYCYLLLPENRTVGEVAVKRLKAIEEFSMLGAGFKIAMRDLEIRGAGNILGPEQSGHIAAVGYEMYCQLLDRAVRELKNEVVVVPSETSIEIGVTGLIPKAYIPSDSRRMDAYRRTSLAASPVELERLREELVGAYGPIPAPVERLLQLAELRIGANMLEVRSITVRDKDVIMRIPPTRAEELGAKLEQAKGNVVVLPPKKGESSSEVYYRPPENFMEPGTLLNVLRTRLGAVAPADRSNSLQKSAGHWGPRAGAAG